MRRNRISGGGGGGNFSSGGPLLTDHLKNIDLELNLLKRKREMLEQQQFIQPLMPQSNFNQVPYYVLEPKQSGSNRDFSHLYKDGPQQYREPFSRKRQPANDLQHNSYPKRSVHQGQRIRSSAGISPAGNQRPYATQNQQTKSTSFKYGQSKQFIGQKINNQKQPNRPSNFVTNKVTKTKKAFVPPNKLKSQPVADRNKLVAAAIKSVAAVESRDCEALRLLPNKEPTNQMTGRLELALGTILKDIRDQFGDRSQYQIIRTPVLQRLIKQTIRERIRNAMLGKVVVSATQEIVKEYRSMYPKDTDIEIVNIALEAGGIKPDKDPKPIEKERPEEYFKRNMYRIIDHHLHEMFEKLEDIYNPPTSDEKEGGCPEEVTAEESNIEIKVEEVAANKDDASVASNTENPKTVMEKVTEITKDEAANTENFKSSNQGGDAPVNAEDLFPLANEYKKMLPRLLKKHIPTILKLFHFNKMYKEAVADIATTTRAKVIELRKPIDSSTMETSEPAQTPNKCPAPYTVLPYYAKVIGKPELPKKNVLSTFLEQFSPKSIKKHRSIQNLLFIGFSEKSDFDAIVKADGTVIDCSTLNIRVCDKNTKTPEENAFSTANGNIYQNVFVNKDAHNESPPDSDILGNKLDGQITDLLSSIRKSEEESLNVVSKSDTQEGEKSNDDVAENENHDKAGVVNSVEVLDNNIIIETNKVSENSEVLDSKEDLDNNGSVKDTEKEVNTHDTENKDEVKAEPQVKQPAVDEKNDQLADLQSIGGRATPTRASTRLANTPATPSTVRTRRASRLLQN